MENALTPLIVACVTAAFSTYLGHMVLQEKVLQENKQMLLRIDHMSRENRRLEQDIQELKSEINELQREHWRKSSIILAGGMP